MKCKYCLSEKTKLLFVAENRHGRELLSQEGFEILECLNCKVTFTAVEINNGYYEKYYLDGYYNTPAYNFLIKSILAWLSNISFHRRLQLIKQYHPKGMKILEVGCGWGGFLHSLPKTFQKSGIEINKQAYQYIKDNYQDIEIYNTKIDNSICSKNEFGEFDIIVMWHVFEHIDNVDSFMKGLSCLLAKNGVLILEIPNRNSLGFNLTRKFWFHLDTPRHLFFYGYEGMKILLAKYNLKIVEYKSNAIDYFQDLAFSFYMCFAGKNPVVNGILAVLLIPFGLIIRLLMALFVLGKAEINTYVIKKIAFNQ
ncbi:MAG: class I SAM-dependent methyltransferase [Candidatus Omnitrophota bacterium]